MLKAFLQFVKENELFDPNEKVLLAISGGVDSMVLLHLFEKSEFQYGIVHCNFQLRAEASDRDEDFVRQQVHMHGVPAWFEKFDTREYARLSGISIEMAARELRYTYFEKIRKEFKYKYIATAHHQDDLIETFFLNLSRKTGLKGLTGIKGKSGRIVRPLLFTDRNNIEQYARENDIDYREDESNNNIIFQRNFVRHNLIPLLSELNPAFKKNLLASVENLKDAEKVYNISVEREKKRVAKTVREEIVIDIDELRNTPFAKVLLLEILSPLDFNATVVEEIYRGLDSLSGKQYFSKTHRVIKDRDRLFVSQQDIDQDKIYYIEKGDMELFEPFDIAISNFPADTFEIERNSSTACLDRDKLEFPLLIRKWQKGDYFQPLGMTGFKKVSDFLIDQKVPVHVKDKTWLLCSGQKILWIMGHRIDNRFKITPDTKEVLKIEIK